MTQVRPILRMLDAAATERFYVDYLGATIDWRHAADDGPQFWQVTVAGSVLWLSSHHDDGTPGSVVVIVVPDVDAAFDQLARDYPFFNAAVDDGPAGGREFQVIDPASNRIRFWQPADDDQ